MYMGGGQQVDEGLGLMVGWWGQVDVYGGVGQQVDEGSGLMVGWGGQVDVYWGAAGE